MRKTNKPFIKDQILFDANSPSSTNVPIQVGSKSWFRWLAKKDGFVYEGDTGHFTARREQRRENSYWYGYRRLDGKLTKVYLGKSKELNKEILEQASAILAGQVPLQLLEATGSTADQNSRKNPQSSVIISPARALEEMPHPSLAKINPPALPKNLLPRPRLTNRMKTPIAIISAPSGFGTSTLLNEWRHGSGMPVAWISLDADDNLPLHFWSTVVASLQNIIPGLGQGWLSQLRISSPSAISTIIVNLTNDIIRATDASNPSQWIGLVLDNYHFIRNPEIHTSLQTWLEHMPPALRLVIAGQSKPPLALGYLRAKGMVVELEADDLRFNLDEGVEYLLRNTPIPLLAYSQMQTLIKRVEGWITGLVLAISVLGEQGDRTRFKDDFTSKQPLLREFFAEHVMNRQPLDVQSFLIKTSVLKKMNGPLCDAITGKSDSAEMLARLKGRNLFVESAEKPGWYRYHNLFAEELSLQLQEQFPDEIQQLHREAAQWYYAQNMLPSAIFHFLESQSWEEAAALIEQVSLNELDQSGEDSRLLSWLLRLPEEVMQHHKVLLALYLRLAGISFPAAEVDGFLARIEKNISSLPEIDHNDIGKETLTEIQKFRRIWVTQSRGNSEFSNDGNYDNAEQLLEGILQFHRDFRSDIIKAENIAKAIYETAQTKHNLYAILLAGGSCANLALSQGHIRQSEQIAQQVLRQSFSISGKFPEPASISLTALARVCYMRNQLGQAHQLLSRATEVNPNPTSSIEPVSIAILRAKIQSAQGDNEAAFTTIQAVREFDYQRPSSIWTEQDLIAYLELFRFRMGDLDTTDTLPLDRGEIESSAFSALVRAEIHIEQKRSLAAEEILNYLIGKYPHGIYLLPILRAKLLLSIALFDQQRLKEARKLLIEVSRLAAPEYYIRPFLDYGPNLESLISFVLHSENLNPGIQSFLKGVLTMLGKPGGIQRILPSNETEKLTLAASISPRELEILKLLSTGLSNREIATQCCISPSTVKTHIENVYFKLHVNSRLQAIAQAQMLNLI